MLQAWYETWVGMSSEEQPLSDSICAFSPSHGAGYGRVGVKDPASEAGAKLSWEAFWAPNSPFMHSGKARVRVELSMPKRR